MDAETSERAADLPNVRGERLPHGRAFVRRELRRLFQACAKEPSPADRRDAALIAVLYGGGLRRSEVVALDVSDYNPVTTESPVRHGKGQKACICYVTSSAKLAFDASLVVRGSEAGSAVSRPANGRGRPLATRRMTDQSVLLLLQRRAKLGAHLGVHASISQAVIHL